MDLFQHRYYRLGKVLMSLLGQWPYQSNRVRSWILPVFILPITGQTIAQMLAVVKYRDDWNILLQCLLPNFFVAVGAVKYLGFLGNSQKRLKLLNRIRTDWQVWARDLEIKILHKYGDRGEKIIFVFTVTLYSVLFVGMIQPLIQKLIHDVLHNSTEPGKFLFPVVYYHLDMEKYYFYLVTYYTVCGFMVLTISVSSDVMLIIYVQHVCGIFAAVGHKLERIGSNDTLVETEGSTYAFEKTDMMYLASCIDRHNDAIEYANLITASYKWNFFFNLGLGMILINISGLQMLLSTGDLATTIPSSLLTLSLVFYFYIECSISQFIMDHSISIRFYTYNSKWYRLSPKAQKLLQLMTIRCNVPCHLTAGKMLVMSVQTFGLVFRTFLSYFAFLRSMHSV